MHRQSSSPLKLLFLDLEWSQFHTLMEMPSEVLRTDKASPTVAETERDLSGGLPRQSSETSWANNKSAMQVQKNPGIEKMKKKQKRGKKLVYYWWSTSVIYKVKNTKLVPIIYSKDSNNKLPHTLITWAASKICTLIPTNILSPRTIFDILKLETSIDCFH